VVYGATITSIPSQIAIGGGEEKCHVTVLWWCLVALLGLLNNILWYDTRLRPMNREANAKAMIMMFQ